MTESERRRRRPAVSCTLCRRRKIKCNREAPCSNCVRCGNESCIYRGDSSQTPRQHVNQNLTTDIGLRQKSPERLPIDRGLNESRASIVPTRSSSSLTSSTCPSTLGSQQSARDIQAIKREIRQLEEQLSKATAKNPPFQASSLESTSETIKSDIGGTFYVHRKGGQSTSCVTHKSRQFGQSHWINVVSLIHDVAEIFTLYLREETTKVVSGIQRCKSLARVIKSQRAPPWPTSPTADLPPKDVADELVDCYLRTIETVYRILHIPTFRRDYDALWTSDSEADTAFLVQLKLVLALGAISYDEHFSLRTSAVRWVYEAQTWLSEPKFKSRLSIQSLQTEVLLLLSRELVGVGGDPIWISVGAVLRRAVYMGMHRDPGYLQNGTLFAAEMRRRLWNTILEIVLQSSLTSGGPPLISLDDFDTQPPGNFDDDQLVIEGSIPKPEDDFTQTSIAIALCKTFSTRLAVTKFLNDLGSRSTYEETLRLDKELSASYKALCQTLLRFLSTTDSASSRFEIRVADFVMHRYISALHIPFFSPALHESAYAFSRKVVVETSLKLWRAVYQSRPTSPAECPTDTAFSDRDDLARLTRCGSGFYRTVAIQATLLIAMELKTQLQEEKGLSAVNLRPDLISVPEDAKTWCLQCHQAGETNVKGYFLLCVVSARIEGLRRGFGEDELSEVLLKAAEDALENCLPILEEMSAWGQGGGAESSTHEISLSTQPEVMEDWNFMVSDALFNISGIEDPMSWMFNDQADQKLLW